MRFVLIHGGFHGAWCWQRVIPELERLGHTALAIDLPGHGTRAEERSTLADRRDAIVEVLEAGDVLVGHSGGGYDMTLAADVTPDRIQHMVYLAAGLPVEGESLLFATGGAPAASSQGRVEKLMDDQTGMSRAVHPREDGRMVWEGFQEWWDFFYHDCDEASARAAYDQRSPAPIEFLTETVHVPHFWKAEIPRSYILCLQDRAKPHSTSESVINRLGVDPLTIDSSHSPFYSRPAECAELLVRATETQPHSPLKPFLD